LKNGNENVVSGTSTIHVFAENDDGSREALMLFKQKLKLK